MNLREDEESQEWKILEWTCAALAVWVVAAIALILHEMAKYYLSKWIS